VPEAEGNAGEVDGSVGPDKISILDLFELYFPGSFLPELVELLGTKATLRLVTVFGGLKLDVPLRAQVLNAYRDVAIYYAIKNGVKAPVLGRGYGVSRQRVWQIYETASTRIEGFLKKKKGRPARSSVYCDIDDDPVIKDTPV
jgi:hypothetical protein